MSESAVRLQQTADGQISELIDLLATRDQSALKLQCPGREKLGDGTVAASAMHTADNYHRIADFLRANDHRPRGPREAKRSHCLPRFAQAPGHPAGRSGSRPHSLSYSAQDIDLRRLLERLSTARESLRALADLSDEQLGTIPPASEMKFCDRQRTLQDWRDPLSSVGCV